MSSRRSHAPTSLLVVLMLAAMLGVLEGLSRVAVWILADDPRFSLTPVAERFEAQTRRVRGVLRSQGTALLELDSELGWRYAPNRSTELYSSGAQGARGPGVYSPSPPAAMLRVTAFGDSFVHGNEVTDEQAWSRQLEQLDPRVEVMNFGVGGYGTDQAWLLGRRWRNLGAQVVILGFAEVDYARNVNRYRRFLSTEELPLFKPRFRLATDGTLALIPNPVPGAEGLARLLDDPRGALAAAPDDWFFDAWVWRNPLYDASALVRLGATLGSTAWRTRLRPDRLYRSDLMNRECEAYPLLLALVREFAEEVRTEGGRFLLVIFPGRDEDIWGDGPPAYAPLIEDLDGIDVLDLAPSLAAEPALSPDNLRAPGGHYGPAAHAVVARAIHAAVAGRGSD